MTRDLRWAIRWLRGSPWFAAGIALMLALGVGVNTAVFSVVNAVLLQPLPYNSASRLVRVEEVSPKSLLQSLPLEEYRVLERTSVFDRVLAYRKDVVTLTGVGAPTQVFCLETSAEIFPLLGERAQLGRALVAADGAAGAPEVAVLSDRLWRRLFRSDVKVIGKSITISDRVYTVAGVMPAGFEFPSPDAEMWTALDLESTPDAYVNVIARRKTDASLGQVQTALNIAASRLEREDPAHHAGLRFLAAPWRETPDRPYELSLLFVFGAVGLVLLIACANAGSLLLGRAVQRRKEISIRTALGASFWRIARQLLAESLVLAVIASAAGIASAYFALRLLIRGMNALPVAIPHVQSTKLNGSVFIFCAMLCVAIAALSSLAPVLLASKTDPQTALRGVQASAPKRSVGLFSALVAAETALAFLLLAVSGLFLRSLVRVQEADKGFRPDHVLTLRVPLGSRMQSHSGKYDTRARQIEFYREVLERIERIPGVEAAAVVNNLPLSGFNTTTVYTRPDGSTGGFATRTISPRYFAAMGTPLVEGRLFTDADRVGAPGVAIANESLARGLFPGRDVVGEFLPGEGTAKGAQIVGVVKDSWQGGYDKPIQAEMYLPYTQYIFGAFLSTFVVRTSGRPLGLADAVRKQVWAVDPNEPVTKVETMDGVVAESIWRPRFSAWIFTVLGGLALVLSTAGIYAVVAYLAALKKREIGIRVALGATPAAAALETLRDAMTPVCLGLAAGALAAFAMARWLSGLLYEVKGADPLSYAVAAAVVLAAGIIASALPAWKAAFRDPLESLRAE